MSATSKPPKDDGVLRRFMQEMFCFESLLQVGFFNEDMRNDYQAQADKVCKYFGYQSVYEYRAKEIRVHVSYVDGHRPAGEPFVTTIPGIYDD